MDFRLHGIEYANPPEQMDEALKDGLSGTLSYFRLGKELRKQAILDGNDLPSYAALAGYVFFTATGEESAVHRREPRARRFPHL